MLKDISYKLVHLRDYVRRNWQPDEWTILLKDWIDKRWRPGEWAEHRGARRKWRSRENCDCVRDSRAPGGHRSTGNLAVIATTDPSL
jgi:hypothetical protein